MPIRKRACARPPMVAEPRSSLQERVLLAAPTRRDAEVTCHLLSTAGIGCDAVVELSELADGVEAGVGALLLTDVALVSPGIEQVFTAIARQPGWSDVPVILLMPDRQQSVAMSRALDAFTNMTLLDRPVSTRSLISAVMAALRARARQFQIRDQMAELRLAGRALRDADRRKDEFLATLAHELRNPLAPIRTGLDVLARVPGDAPQAIGVRTMMQRQLTLLVKLIDDLLDVSRIATGKVMLQREIVDLRSVIESALEGSEPLLSAAGHRVTVQLPPGPVGTVGDPLRLAQVVGNLVNNAAKYTPGGGNIEVTLSVEGDDAVVRVRDNGVGIPAHMLEHVFDMFAQVDNTRDQSQGGLGIGLSLVRRLMDLHGGSVTAESPGRNQGSTFTLRLRSVAMPPAGEVATETAEHPARARPRVLVVDDNTDAADSLALALRLDGYDTRVEYSGEEALRAASEFAPTAIVCDIGLPEMDGHEIARRLRADPGRAGTVLVAVTGLGSEEDKRRTQVAGFDFHLVKPVALASVQDILSRL